MPQAGTESDWYGFEWCDPSSPFPQLGQGFGNWSWWEYFPDLQQGLPGLTSAGDVVWSWIYASDVNGTYANPSAGYASFWVCNEGTSSNWCTFQVGQLPSGTAALIGTTAEWIFERPGWEIWNWLGEYSSGQAPLAHFLDGAITSPGAWSPVYGQEDPTYPGAARNITMTRNGDVAATTSIPYEQAINFQWVHP
jgi:hypothetical protein